MAGVVKHVIRRANDGCRRVMSDQIWTWNEAFERSPDFVTVWAKSVFERATADVVPVFYSENASSEEDAAAELAQATIGHVENGKDYSRYNSPSRYISAGMEPEEGAVVTEDVPPNDDEVLVPEVVQPTDTIKFIPADEEPEAVPVRIKRPRLPRDIAKEGYGAL